MNARVQIPEAQPDETILAIARALARRLAREEYARRQRESAASDSTAGTTKPSP